MKNSSFFTEYGSEANQDVGQKFDIGLRQNFDSNQEEDEQDNIVLFSCTSGSNKKIKTEGNEVKIVTYEDCRFNQGKAFLQNTGEFVAKNEGVYDFSATFLMKTDYDGAVNVQLMRGDVSITGQVSSESLLDNLATFQVVIAQTRLDAAGDAKVGTTTSLSSVLRLMPEDNVYLRLQAEGQGGIVNSDWFVLKFSGYKRPEETKMLTCSLHNEANEIYFRNCIGNLQKVFSNRLITIQQDGNYKVSLVTSYIKLQQVLFFRSSHFLSSSKLIHGPISGKVSGSSRNAI